MSESINSVLSEEELEVVNGGAYSGPVFRYIIQSGDCLSVLAQKYGTTVDILVAINNILDRNKIYAGKTLLIPCKG